MFNYKKQIAYVALILFIILTVVIWLFALQPGDNSGKTSSKLYAFLFGLDYDDQQTKTDIEEQDITSLSLSTPSDVLLVGQTISLNVKATPANYTESIEFSSSDEKIAKVNNKGVVTSYSKGTVIITAKGKNGKVTSQVTITVYEESSALDNLDKNKFTITDLPETLAQNDCIKPIILYDNEAIALNYTLLSSNKLVFDTNGAYILTHSQGTATLTVKVGGETLFEKQLTIIDEVKEEPKINSVYVGETLVVENQPITVFLGKNYDLNINIDNENTAVQSYIINRNNNITTAIYSNASKFIQIYARQCGTTIVELYSRTNQHTPLKRFTLNIIPPKLVSLGLPEVKEYHINVEYSFSLLASDKNSLEGYYYKVLKNGETVAPGTNGKYKFTEIGTYDIVFSSTYYPEDTYTFSIVLEDPSTKAILRKEFGHFGLFALLGFFAMIAFGRLIQKYLPKALVCGISGLIVAIISEILQLPIFTQSRGASVNDVLIDYSGFIFGLAFAFCVIHFIHYIRSKRRASEDIGK